MVSITGMPPFELDLQTEYPVLAVNMRYTHIGYSGFRRSLLRSGSEGLLAERLPFYTKETYFLVGDKSSRFQWVSAAECSSYIPGLPQTAYPVHTPGRKSRYGISKNIGEYENMIYPVRPFSITGISMEGFDPEKGYPVLAIDMDQCIPEHGEQDEEEEDQIPEQPQSQSLAFFLVGDDNGEFTWVAEDECRLYPL
ncbi:MAG: hypothetical protein JXA46_09090 [Dehalococcoidales bacterium]|nr:hypothetical protein [Dehalococcoidales bacterium]